MRLFLNGNLQFHSRDEYRYHEALVHPAMAAHGAPKRVLVLGGGDGMAVREVLKHPSVEQVTLVELDPHITQLFATQPLLRALNGDALRSPKLTHRQRRRVRLARSAPTRRFDVIVVDFPDPTNFSLGKLYTTSFYAAARPAPGRRRLRGGADHVAADRAQELLDRGDDDRGGRPDRDAVPRARAELRRMGLRHRQPPAVAHAGARCRAGLRFLERRRACRRCSTSRPTWRASPAEPNRLSNQVLVHTFEEEWGKVQR